MSPVVTERRVFIDAVNSIDDKEVLRSMLIQKEQEKDDIANNLDIAARLGLAISEKNEELQKKLNFATQAEAQAYMRLTVLEEENRKLFSKASQSNDLSSQLAASEDQVKTLREHKAFLQKELDTARRELKRFRKELDSLTGQMNDMVEDMWESRNKVNTYSKKLVEVEQRLSDTQETNVNLSISLDRSLNSHRINSATTTQIVKMIQADLSKVVLENEHLRASVSELENRQVKTEGKLSEMMVSAQEYAHLLEEAQDTIHSLSETRLESDIENLDISPGRSRGHADKIILKESPQMKGTPFSTEVEQQLEKTIEERLKSQMNPTRTHFPQSHKTSEDMKKAAAGLKYLLSAREVEGKDVGKGKSPERLPFGGGVLHSYNVR
ncbi:408_t:CDS:2 [Funneliformis geosporum]|uniref:4840_t:CDS:1 n=1 Tax=Funneliformis geosporum TaxID=1117311 RepID=A0A9W4SLS4_9GLOM|nr:408_t:CDS:2 [Funneliformis geosporum]CAI2171624.1 4840_t:CDS:2 [Funneliformis geosporum]